jgi:hypothetical protein
MIAKNQKFHGEKQACLKEFGLVSMEILYFFVLFTFHLNFIGLLIIF